MDNFENIENRAEIKGNSYVFRMLQERGADIKWDFGGPSQKIIIDGIDGKKVITIKWATFNKKAKKWTWNFKNVKSDYFVCIAKHDQGSDIYVFPKRMLGNVLKMSHRQAFITGHYSFYRENWEIITGEKEEEIKTKTIKYLKDNVERCLDLIDEILIIEKEELSETRVLLVPDGEDVLRFLKDKKKDFEGLHSGYQDLVEKLEVKVNTIKAIGPKGE